MDSAGQNEIGKKDWLINPTGETESAIIDIVSKIDLLDDNPTFDQKQNILDELRKIDPQAMADVLSTENSKEVWSNLKAIEEKIGSAIVESSITSMTVDSIVGGGLNASISEEALQIVRLVVDAAENEPAIRNAAGDEINLSNAVSFSMKLENIETQENGKLYVPIAITFDVPAGIDVTKMVVLHNSNEFGLETLTPILSVNNTKATMIIDHFSDFMIAEKKDGSGNNDKGSSALSRVVIAGATIVGATVATVAIVKTVDKLVEKAKAAEAEREAAEHARKVAEDAKKAEESAMKAAKLLEEAKKVAGQALNESLNGNEDATFYQLFNKGCEAIESAQTPDEVMAVTVEYVNLISQAKTVVETKISQSKLSTAKNGKLKVRFKNPGLDGTVSYQIVRSTKKDFSKNKKAYTVKAKDQKTLTLTNAKNLKKGTKYYYKVRAKVKLSDGTIVYTNWSNVRCATCKKTR